MARRVLLSPEAVQKLAPWYDQGLLRGTRVLHGSLFGAVFGWFGQAAVTVNGAVHLTRRAPDLESVGGMALLAHELYHAAQQREMGWWRYLGRYVWRWRPRHISRGWEHPMEAAAYARGAEVRQALT